MATMDSDIRAAHLRRLHALKLRAAHSGYGTPPEVQNEIEDIEVRLGITQPSSIPENANERHIAVIRAMMQVQALSVETRRRVDMLMVAMPLLFLLDRLLERIIWPR